MKKIKCLNMNIIFSEIIIFLAIFYMLVKSGIVFNQDTAWHIKVGEQILKNGIPYKDMFSIHNNLNFMAHEWLSSILFYFINILFGLKGFYLITGIAYLIIFNMCLKMNKEKLWMSLLLFLLLISNFYKMAAALPDTLATISMIFGLFIWFSNYSYNKKIIFNILNVILIVNLHGGMLGAYMCQLFVLGFLYIIVNEENRKNSIKKIITYVLSSIVAGLLNPYGIKIYTYSIKMLSSNATSMLADWTGYTFVKLETIIVFIILIVLIVINLIDNLMKKTSSNKELSKIVIVIFWIMMTLYYQRCIGLLFITILLLESDNILNGIHILLKYLENKRIYNKSIKERIKKVFYIVIALFLSIISIISLKTLPEKMNITVEEYINKDFISKDMINYLKKDSVILYNSFELGGYLIYEDIPVFIDGRTDPYLKEYSKNCTVFDEYWESCYNTSKMATLIKKYKFNTLILNKNNISTQVYLNNNDWQVIAETKYTILLKKA